MDGARGLKIIERPIKLGQHVVRNNDLGLKTRGLRRKSISRLYPATQQPRAWHLCETPLNNDRNRNNRRV